MKQVWYGHAKMKIITHGKVIQWNEEGEWNGSKDEPKGSIKKLMKEKGMHFRLSLFQKIIVNRKLNAAHLIFKLGPSKSWKERGNDNMFLFELKIHHRKCWSNSSKTFFLLLNIVRSSIRDKQNIPFF